MLRWESVSWCLLWAGLCSPREAPEKAAIAGLPGLRSVSSSNFANKALRDKPHCLRLKMAIRAKQLTFGSTDLNQVDHILVFEELEDLDFPQGCDGELCGRKTDKGSEGVSAPRTQELAQSVRRGTGGSQRKILGSEISYLRGPI